MSVLGKDVMVSPPAERQYESASGKYRLTVRVPQNSRHATGEMRGAMGELLWSKALPQDQGPRFTLVANNGVTVFFDEFITITSRMAILLWDRTGKPLHQAGFQDVQRTLNMTLDRITAQAKFGVWMSEAPRLDAAQRHATVRTGGKTLAVQLADGKLLAR